MVNYISLNDRSLEKLFTVVAEPQQDVFNIRTNLHFLIL